MLKFLDVQGVGPVRPGLSASLGERLNVLTGDNGLGKSFFLDICFWTLTGQWPGGRMAMPERDNGPANPEISYQIVGKKEELEPKRATYSFQTQTWRRPEGRPAMPGLVIYATMDGGFAVWDPARNYRPASGTETEIEAGKPRAYHFTSSSLADGLREDGKVLCRGLIDDWSSWYYQQGVPSSSSASREDGASSGSAFETTGNAFDLLKHVAAQLSHPAEEMIPALPSRVFLNDTREYPTLVLPYGKVPYPHWPAGVKRIVGLAYLLVWAWREHVQAAALRREEPVERLILLVDEIESHLHPKWQRTIAPALLQVAEGLGAAVQVQMAMATHSPLVLASLEPHFDTARDRLFWFELQSGNVRFREYGWAVQGDAVSWLTSDIFGLEQARSREAEEAIEAAEAYMRGERDSLRPGLRTEREIDEALKRFLPGIDPFWPRWYVEVQR